MWTTISVISNQHTNPLMPVYPRFGDAASNRDPVTPVTLFRPLLPSFILFFVFTILTCHTTVSPRRRSVPSQKPRLHTRAACYSVDGRSHWSILRGISLYCMIECSKLKKTHISVNKKKDEELIFSTWRQAEMFNKSRYAHP